MPGAHLNGMVRACGAVTMVVNQSTTFVSGRLWAVEGDPNSHGDGALIATGGTVFIQGKKVIVNSPDSASADALCPILDAAHCAPATAQGSYIGFAYGAGGEGPPIEEPQPGLVNLYAANLVVGSPEISTGEDNLTSGNLEAGSATLEAVPTFTSA